MDSNNLDSAWLRTRNRYRGFVVWVLAIVPVVYSVWHYWGAWSTFFGALAGHWMFWQAIVAYLYDKTIWPGGATPEDGKAVRGGVMAFAVVGYMAMFFYFF
ncbi:hypothetical protein [Billgrantia montanilacus]|uniref:hypothetical protein n=1 Tax=Billgrantia montanilacus TaxID=2282305 RepID=UPI0011C07905|nr:hypothetical protein [Halomonas montanilacus]